MFPCRKKHTCFVSLKAALEMKQFRLRFKLRFEHVASNHKRTKSWFLCCWTLSALVGIDLGESLYHRCNRSMTQSLSDKTAHGLQKKSKRNLVIKKDHLNRTLQRMEAGRHRLTSFLFLSGLHLQQLTQSQTTSVLCLPALLTTAHRQHPVLFLWASQLFKSKEKTRAGGFVGLLHQLIFTSPRHRRWEDVQHSLCCGLSVR